MSTETTSDLDKNNYNPINDFSIKLYNSYKNKQHVVSPASVMFVLGMFYKGTCGVVEEEFMKMIGMNKHKFFDKLVELYKILSPCLCLTNGIYVNDIYKERLKSSYASKIAELGIVETLDVSKCNEEVERINTHVEKNTNGLIKNFLQMGAINVNTTMLILNTIYFKCNWENQFCKKDTIQNFPFKGPSGNVEMMTMCNKRFMYYEDSTTQVIEISYRKIDNDTKANYSMGFVLAKDEKQIPDINIQCLETYRKYFKKKKINLLQIPKFKCETSLVLNDSLHAMGLETMFKNADVSDMIDKYDNAHVSSVIHKALVIVDEEGTEVTGATAMMVCAVSRKCEEINFIADHPFMFYIRETSTNTLLFIGSFM